MNAPTISIPMQPMESSNIHSHGYDANNRTLAVQFKNGGLYHYNDVPPAVAADFANAKSAGSFFAKEIRFNYESTRIETDPEPKAEDDAA